MRHIATSIRWGFSSSPGGARYPQIEISPEPDWSLFDRIGELMTSELRGRWSERLDGPDQRYWDFEKGGGSVTLHLEHYLGISLYASAGAQADELSLALLQQVYELLKQAESA